MNEETKIHLIKLLDRIEKASQEIVKTRGYSKEVAKIRFLQELLKEQTGHENTRHSNREIR
jgi:hypothetical protein